MKKEGLADWKESGRSGEEEGSCEGKSAKAKESDCVCVCVLQRKARGSDQARADQ